MLARSNLPLRARARFEQEGVDGIRAAGAAGWAVDSAGAGLHHPDAAHAARSEYYNG